MTSTHNLDEGMSEYFEFILNGNVYRMRYPETDEMVAVSKMTSNDDINKKMYDFIEPVDKTAPAISVAMGKTKMNKARKFLAMIKEEIGL